MTAKKSGSDMKMDEDCSSAILRTDSSLSPDVEATKKSLASGFDAANLITAYAHALQNVYLTPATTPPEQWYNDLAANLARAQDHATIWIKDLGPKVTATVPQTIISYDEIFSIATDDIISILDDILNNQSGKATPEQIQNIKDLIGAQLQELGIQKDAIIQVQQGLQTFSTNLNEDHIALLEGQNAVQKALIEDQTKLNVINAKITSIQEQIQAHSNEAALGYMTIGIGVFITVVGIAIAFVTLGVGLVIVGVGVLTIGAGITVAAVFSEKVKKDMEDLNNEMLSLSDTQKQAAALGGISTSVGSLVAQNEVASKALSEVLTVWKTLELKLGTVMDDLNKAKPDEVSIIVKKVDLKASKMAWADLVAFAKEMQSHELKVSEPIVMPEQRKMLTGLMRGI
ncbi:MAG: HBL/NHE enterotoxin family protein [Methanothrix sp.]